MSQLRVTPPKTDSKNPIDSSPLALQPELLAAFNRLYGTLWSRGVLDHPTKELARLRNANRVNCTFCKATRFSQAKADGLDENQIEQISEYEDSELTERQKLVLRYTDVFLTDSHSLSDELKEAIQAELSDAELTELTAGLALFMGFSKIAVSLGGMPERPPTMEMPTPV